MTRYDAVGQCIYCGTTEAKLSDEHIVPLGLNGMFVLPKASCASCATATSKVERIVLRDVFLHLRTVAGLNTRRPKRRPTHFPLKYNAGSGEQVITLPADEFPVSLFLFEMLPARILRGLPDAAGVDQGYPWSCINE